MSGMGETIITQGKFLVLVARGIAHILVGDNGTAVVADGIVAVIAPLAEGRIIIPGVVILPDPSSTGAADYCLLLQTAWADRITAGLLILGHRVFLVATGANKCGFLHGV